ncbi:uncharacterized protein LOC122790906 [Protopterus annectens]|uniref:uncharacterized protein LOC122790906 n=1 Tax=Protopterus annectens TaxID=7888 RepID=UPI001CFAF373|nr:uncharacterized protein LOC122790906 [Protopterus annectens]
MGAKASRGRTEPDQIHGVRYNEISHAGKDEVQRRRRNERHSVVPDMSFTEQLSPGLNRSECLFDDIREQQSGVRNSISPPLQWLNMSENSPRTDSRWHHGLRGAAARELPANRDPHLNAAALRVDCMVGRGGRHHPRPLSESDRGVYILTSIFVCPFCKKSVPVPEARLHLTECLKPARVSYNVDLLNRDAGECTICLEDLKEGETIARLACLCIYHKSCIDSWNKVKPTCPQHPFD